MIYYVFNRSRTWQEYMKMIVSKSSLMNYRICNLHFTDASYCNLVVRKLNKDAVPTLRPCTSPLVSTSEKPEEPRDPLNVVVESPLASAFRKSEEIITLNVEEQTFEPQGNKINKIF